MMWSFPLLQTKVSIALKVTLLAQLHTIVTSNLNTGIHRSIAFVILTLQIAVCLSFVHTLDSILIHLRFATSTRQHDKLLHPSQGNLLPPWWLR